MTHHFFFWPFTRTLILMNMRCAGTCQLFMSVNIIYIYILIYRSIYMKWFFLFLFFFKYVNTIILYCVVLCCIVLYQNKTENEFLMKHEFPNIQWLSVKHFSNKKLLKLTFIISIKLQIKSWFKNALKMIFRMSQKFWIEQWPRNTERC